LAYRTIAGSRGLAIAKLDKSVDTAARQYALKHQTTVESLLVALWQVLLFRYTHASDQIIAINIADVAEPETQAGAAHPPSLLRQTIVGSMCFDDCVSKTMQALSDLSQHPALRKIRTNRIKRVPFNTSCV